MRCGRKMTVLPGRMRSNVSSSRSLVSSSSGTCRLLDDVHGRVAQDGPGQGDAELLAGPQRRAHFADRRLVAVRQLLNELMRVGDLGRLDDLRDGIRRVAAADVVGDGVVEDQVRLQDDADLRPQRIERQPFRFLSSMRISPRGRVEETRQQSKRRRASRPSDGPTRPTRSPAAMRQVEVVEQHPARVRVTQRHVLEFDADFDAGRNSAPTTWPTSRGRSRNS